MDIWLKNVNFCWLLIWELELSQLNMQISDYILMYLNRRNISSYEGISEMIG